MSYQVLARKWRPQVFEDVVGQEHITDVLKNSLETGRLHHGYLFTGIRGIGKTTTARILAKALNCLHGPTPHPCNECEFCREVTEGYSMDVEEIDGASNRGVDEVRILQEDVGYAPSRSRYKVFIIDEVHMLTTPAFNALLKTLEEPPANVVFIMATTEVWKIPVTILSRCQQFLFKKGTSEQLIELLRKLSQHEQITISNKSLTLLAKSAGGSIRDAENLLDQVIGFCGNEVKDDEVRYVLGIPEQELLNSFLTAIFAHQASRIFSLMEQLVNQGHNLRFFCMELMERIRNLVVLKVTQQADQYLSLFDYTRSDLEHYARQTTLSELQQLYWRLSEAERDIKFSPNPRFILEMALAGMADIQALEPIEDLHSQLQTIKTMLEQNVPGETQEYHEKFSEKSELADSSARLPSRDLLLLWDETLRRMKETRPALAARLKSAIPVQLTQDELTVGFHQDAEFSKQALEKSENSAMLAEALQEQLGRSVRIVTTIHSGAMSIETMRQKLAQRTESLPRPEASPQDVNANKTSSSREQRSSRRGDGNEKGNWEKRSGSAKQKYKPPVQITVQDLVRLFDGEIEE